MKRHTSGEEREREREKERERDRDRDRDRLSELPDCVLLHILNNCMNARDAVQTCILSKRWKNLWKSLTTLSFFHSGAQTDFKRQDSFHKFVPQVLSGRDGNISLLNLSLLALAPIGSELLNMVTEYAVLHNVQELFIRARLTSRNISPIFSCQSLTFLELCNHSSYPPLELPESLQLPALESLHLSVFTFTASDNGCAEPFSTCKLLKTLDLKRCSLHNDAEALFVSNSNLRILKFVNSFEATSEDPNKIVLSTPNLRYLTIDSSDFNYQPISSTCNLPCLKEATIHTTILRSFLDWLQLLANVEILTLSYDTLMLMLKDLSNLTATRAQLPCFVRLEGIDVTTTPPHVKISDEEIKRIFKYLLQK